MDICQNTYERVWGGIFLSLYGIIMLPFPWFYSERYIPGWLGVPVFLYAWIAYGIGIIFLIAIFARISLSRPEYCEDILNFENMEKETTFNPLKNNNKRRCP